MSKEYAPKINDRARELFEWIDKAAEEVNNMPDKQREQHFQDLDYDIAEVNRHSYEINLGQARELARQVDLGWRYRG